MEELHEWEVMWPDSDDRRPPSASDGRVSSKMKARVRGCSTTAAMDIPNRVRMLQGRDVRREENNDNDNDDDNDADDTEFTPPHILTSRRSGGGTRKVAFSLCSGQGRTLKGRDLSYVRNSVLRMTGFLEA
ncbi:hypothetical protein ACMD2_09631 [Ananas comosus]|uniref:Uncharacterized protein n=2 Tax=Ananas comosus TaxID=4615 RepID=A0A199VLH9_ANACO|nr:hypothetical protein ACMD2_09631 [Ananas comosus]CAD1824123.1 unnamed protein product [Ananas comosus var. bracteatus]